MIKLISFCILPFFLFSQKSNNIQFFVNPFIQKIGNLNNQYTSISNSSIEVNYLKNPAFEFGLNYLHKSKSKWGWGIGLSHTSQKQYMSFQVYDILFDQNDVLYSELRSVSQRFLNLRNLITYQFDPNLQISLIIGNIIPFSMTTNKGNATIQNLYINNYTVTPDTTYQEAKANINFQIISNYNPLIQLLVPELNISYKMYNRIQINMGVKLKFFQLDKDSGIIDVKADGFVGNQNQGINKVLHESHVKNTNFAYYIGFSYNLNMKKKSKSIME